MSFKRMKFRVSNESESKEIQKGLFELGYRWVEGSDSPIHIDERYLYTNTEGKITYGQTREFFQARDGEEMELERKVTYNFIPKQKTIILFEKCYYENDVVGMLQNIKEVS